MGAEEQSTPGVSRGWFDYGRRCACCVSIAYSPAARRLRNFEFQLCYMAPVTSLVKIGTVTLSRLHMNKNWYF